MNLNYFLLNSRYPFSKLASTNSITLAIINFNLGSAADSVWVNKIIILTI